MTEPLDKPTENQLLHLLASCGFVGNQTRTAQDHRPVNPPDLPRAYQKLKEFFGDVGDQRKTEIHEELRRLEKERATLAEEKKTLASERKGLDQDRKDLVAARDLFDAEKKAFEKEQKKAATSK